MPGKKKKNAQKDKKAKAPTSVQLGSHGESIQTPSIYASTLTVDEPAPLPQIEHQLSICNIGSTDRPLGRSAPLQLGMHRRHEGAPPRFVLSAPGGSGVANESGLIGRMVATLLGGHPKDPKEASALELSPKAKKALLANPEQLEAYLRFFDQLPVLHYTNLGPPVQKWWWFAPSSSVPNEVHFFRQEPDDFSTLTSAELLLPEEKRRELMQLRAPAYLGPYAVGDDVMKLLAEHRRLAHLTRVSIFTLPERCAIQANTQVGCLLQLLGIADAAAKSGEPSSSRASAEVQGGELALDVADLRVWRKKADGTVDQAERVIQLDALLGLNSTVMKLHIATLRLGSPVPMLSPAGTHFDRICNLRLRLYTGAERRVHERGAPLKAFPGEKWVALVKQLVSSCRALRRLSVEYDLSYFAEYNYDNDADVAQAADHYWSGIQAMCEGMQDFEGEAASIKVTFKLVPVSPIRRVGDDHSVFKFGSEGKTIFADTYTKQYRQFIIEEGNADGDDIRGHKVVEWVEKKIAGKQAQVMLAAWNAVEAVLRMLRPEKGHRNTDLTEQIGAIAKAYGCTPLENMLSRQLKRNKINGAKQIIQNPSTDEQKSKLEKCTFEPYEVYGIDVLMSSGGGKAKSDVMRPTVFKRTDDFIYLKLKASKVAFHEVQSKFGLMPFSLRNLDDEVYCEREGEFVAHFKTTAIIMPNGVLKITGLPLQLDTIECEAKLEDPKLLSLLNESLKPKAKKRKKRGNAGGDEKKPEEAGSGE